MYFFISKPLLILQIFLYSAKATALRNKLIWIVLTTTGGKGIRWSIQTLKN